MHGHEHVESVAPVAQHDERERWLTKNWLPNAQISAGFCIRDALGSRAGDICATPP
jgi:hypothetical protein